MISIRHVNGAQWSIIANTGNGFDKIAHSSHWSRLVRTNRTFQNTILSANYHNLFNFSLHRCILRYDFIIMFTLQFDSIPSFRCIIPHMDPPRSIQQQRNRSRSHSHGHQSHFGLPRWNHQRCARWRPSGGDGAYLCSQCPSKHRGSGRIMGCMEREIRWHIQQIRSIDLYWSPQVCFFLISKNLLSFHIALLNNEILPSSPLSLHIKLSLHTTALFLSLSTAYVISAIY